jgi:hypothetical protein
MRVEKLGQMEITTLDAAELDAAAVGKEWTDTLPGAAELNIYKSGVGVLSATITRPGHDPLTGEFSHGETLKAWVEERVAEQPEPETPAGA